MTRNEDLGLIGQSTQIRAIRSAIRMLEQSNTAVLLLGEAGTGKGVVAQAIGNSRGPFVEVSCAILSGTPGKIMLSGSAEGVFLECSSNLIASATGGTLFLDEISAISLDVQPHLSRILRARTAEKLDCRVISATNYDLVSLVADETFHEELFYQLNTITLFVPPLRHRKEDIPLLVDHFLAQLGSRYTVTKECIDSLLAHAWPGNVRELQGCVQQMVILRESREGPHLDERTPLGVLDLPPNVIGGAR